MLKADLHVHTIYSKDCSTPLDKIVDRCLKTGINCLAICDHGTVTGALEMKKISPFPIIVAEEILTSFGELIGLFLHETIPSGLTAEETIQCIKDQKGLVCIPHPYDRIRPSAFKDNKLASIIQQVDIIEVFNARSLYPRSTYRAYQLANRFSKLKSAGSDAHTPSEIGLASLEMPEFKGPEEFKAALIKGKIHGKKSIPLVHLWSTLAKLGKHSSPD